MRGYAEQSFGLGKSGTAAWRQEAVVAHLDKTSGQHMLQEKVMDQGFCRKGAGALPLGLTILKGEGDLVVHDLENALVAQGDAEDIGSRISEC